MTTPIHTARPLTRRDLLVPALLLLLNLVPSVGGLARLVSVASDRVTTVDNARFLASPTPIVLHVLCASLYGWIGAFQFSRELRLRWPRWHRRAGRILAACGLMTGLSGLWMTAFYAIPTPHQGPLLMGVRLGVGAAMVLSVVLGVTSILRRDLVRHEAFMIRAYALAMGAGTQALVLGPWTLITGEAEGLTRDLLMTVAWGINVVVAERVIAGHRGPQPAGATR